MFIQHVLIASHDSSLISRLQDSLRSTCDLEVAQSDTEALTKLRREWYSWMLIDPALLNPGVAEMARRLSPGTQLVPVTAQHASSLGEMVRRLLSSRPESAEPACEFG
jgi:hypothetical protein